MIALTGLRRLEGEKRSTLTICIQILGIAMNGAGITKIVYGANLNFKIVKTYLDRLGDWELIECKPRIFKTTEKGRRVFEYFRKADRLIMAKTVTL